MTTIPKQVALRLKYGDPICSMCSTSYKKHKAEAIVTHRDTKNKIARCKTCISIFRSQYSKIEYFDEPV